MEQEEHEKKIFDLFDDYFKSASAEEIANDVAFVNSIGTNGITLEEYLYNLNINNKPMAQKTAVEFLIESIDADARGLWTKELRKKAEQAKEMERQQIMDAYIEGVCEEAGYDRSFVKFDPSEEYYNETYKSK